MKHGKKYVDSSKVIDRTKMYEPGEALDIASKNAKAKFDETVELHVKLGVDSKQADQQVRGTTVLPNGTGKTQLLFLQSADHFACNSFFFLVSAITFSVP